MDEEHLPEANTMCLNDAVLQCAAELYEIYYRNDSDVIRHRQDVENALARLMQAYDAFLD